jgi:hypothetical protein
MQPNTEKKKKKIIFLEIIFQLKTCYNEKHFIAKQMEPKMKYSTSIDYLSLSVIRENWD